LFLKVFPGRAKTLDGRFRATRVEIKNSARRLSGGCLSAIGLSLVHCRQIGWSDNRSAEHLAEFVVFVEAGSAIAEEQESGEKNEDAAPDEESLSRLEHHQRADGISYELIAGLA
jgi:hypothetical protein